MRAPAYHFGAALRAFYHFDLIYAGLDQGRIKQNQRRIRIPLRKQGNHRADRMKHARGGLASVFVFDGFENSVVVANESWKIVIFFWPYTVPAVISQVVDHHVIFVGKQSPERTEKIGREAGAMRQDDSRSFRPAMPPDGNFSIGIEFDVKSRKGLGYLPVHRKYPHPSVEFTNE